MLATDMWADIGLILGAYAYGSIPFVWGMARLKGINLRQRGSQNVGSANLAQSAGMWVGILGSILDCSKGLLPIVIGHYLLDADLAILCLAGLAGLVGQMWPISTSFLVGGGARQAAG